MESPILVNMPTPTLDESSPLETSDLNSKPEEELWDEDNNEVAHDLEDSDPENIVNVASSTTSKEAYVLVRWLTLFLRHLRAIYR